MAAGKPLLYVLILFGIGVINANVMLPRKHFFDYSTFQSQVAGSSEWKWKVLWEFTVNPASTIRFTFAPEHKFSVSGSTMERSDRTFNLNTEVCDEYTDTELPYIHQSDSTFTKTKRFSSSPDSYLGFFSSDLSKYMWMYECGVLDSGTCPESETNIKLLYNQGAQYNRPEGIPWARALQDLKQATKLKLDEVRTDMQDFGTWRAAFKYKVINDLC